MLIFILPSSLYLKITQQDGSKLTQRIWVCVPFPLMQHFHRVIPYNVLDANVPNLNIRVSFFTLLSILASVSWQPCLPFSFAYPGGLPLEGPYHAGHLVCVLGGPSLWAEGLFPWLASCSPPSPFGGPFSPARLLCFNALIQKACQVLCVWYSSWF